MRKDLNLAKDTLKTARQEHTNVRDSDLVPEVFNQKVPEKLLRRARDQSRKTRRTEEKRLRSHQRSRSRSTHRKDLIGAVN